MGTHKSVCAHRLNIMYKYQPGEWHNCSDKRALSVLDKHTLPSRSHAAMIMPGEPGTEFEELVQAGYSHEKIRCVDNTTNRFHKKVLQEYYGDQFFNTDVFEFSDQTTETFSYMHFDMCCMSNYLTYRRLLDATQNLNGKSRLRYSGSRTIRGTTAKQRMSDILKGYQMLEDYCFDRVSQSNHRFWTRAAEECAVAEDEPGAILAALFCSLPKDLVVSNVYKKIYLGKYQSSQMFTFWIDFDNSLEPDDDHEMKIVDVIISESQRWRQQ